MNLHKDILYIILCIIVFTLWYKRIPDITPIEIPNEIKPMEPGDIVPIL